MGKMEEKTYIIRKKMYPEQKMYPGGYIIFNIQIHYF